jgi:XapX domain-containing protein
MKIVIAFLIAIGIGAASRWARIPSLAPQAIVGALLIVAMTAGYTITDRCLAAKAPARAPSISAVRPGAPQSSQISDGIRTEPAIATPAVFEQPWRLQIESLQSLVAELLATNEQLRHELSGREWHSGEKAEQSAGTLEGSVK